MCHFVSILILIFWLLFYLSHNFSHNSILFFLLLCLFLNDFAFVRKQAILKDILKDKQYTMHIKKTTEQFVSKHIINIVRELFLFRKTNCNLQFKWHT